MPSRPTPAEVSQLHQPDAPEQLAAELGREKEEVLRLRDLLIARDQELGTARGRLAMIEQGSQRLANAAAKIPIPGATRLLQGMIRLLQRVLR